MQRFVATGIILAAATTSAHAAVFTVSTIGDDGPGSLRQAILDANAAVSPPHHIEFGGAFPVDGIIELFGALPAVEVRVEINGMDRNPTVMPFDATNSFPLLQTEKSLTLRGFTLTQGRAGRRGGCVAGEGIGTGAALVLDRMTFSSCVAVVTSGNEVASGGAVSWPSTGPVTIRQSIFQGNAVATLVGSSALGGAVSTNGPTLIEFSYFIGNIANGNFVAGGAVALNMSAPGSIGISDSVFVDNHAEPEPVPSPVGLGGALGVECTTCTVDISRNYFGSNRSANAGAIFIRGNDGAGAAAVTLYNTSFVRNQASGFGGALLANGTSLDVRHATFHDNAGGDGGHAFVLSSSIVEWSNSVMGSVAPGSGRACSLGATATATIATGNFVPAGDTSCNLVIPGSAPVADFLVLGVDDGELMPVVVFDRSSPVVDGGDSGRCLARDTRGRSRPQDGNGDAVAVCDAGAFEHPGARVFGDGFEG